MYMYVHKCTWVLSTTWHTHTHTHTLTHTHTHTHAHTHTYSHTHSLTLQMLNEEYEEALSLAQQYGLNCDLVYQRQWHSYAVSTETIDSYLVGSADVHNLSSNCEMFIICGSKQTLNFWEWASCTFDIAFLIFTTRGSLFDVTRSTVVQQRISWYCQLGTL